MKRKFDWKRFRTVVLAVLFACLAIGSMRNYLGDRSIRIIYANGEGAEDRFSPGSAADTGPDDKDPGQETSGAETADLTRSPQTGPSQKIDLNTATAEQLESVSGIGPVKAQAILRYREEYGGFSCLEELMEVSGIGEATFAKIRDSFKVESVE